jgi:hypothetical protein
MNDSNDSHPSEASTQGGDPTPNKGRPKEKRSKPKTETSGRWKPRWTKLSLNEIAVDNNAIFGGLNAQFRYVGGDSPLLKLPALNVLEWAQPLMVVENPQSKEGVPRYQLVAGVRTYQLLVEQRASASKAWVLVMSNADPNLDHYRAFDAVVAKLLQSLDRNDLALIGAALLDNDILRKAVNELIAVDSDTKIADVLGMARSSLHRVTEPLRRRPQKPVASDQKRKISFDIQDLDDEGDSVGHL